MEVREIEEIEAEKLLLNVEEEEEGAEEECE